MWQSYKDSVHLCDLHFQLQSGMRRAIEGISREGNGNRIHCIGRLRAYLVAVL
jgi:hypothetical protein